MNDQNTNREKFFPHGKKKREKKNRYKSNVYDDFSLVFSLSPEGGRAGECADESGVAGEGEKMRKNKSPSYILLIYKGFSFLLFLLPVGEIEKKLVV